MPNPTTQPCVIVISGSVGSGKTTIALALARVLGDAAVLIFDHYGTYVEWPTDMAQWMDAGADPSQICVPRLTEDLLALRSGQAIIDPLDGKIIQPVSYIILEEPSGREREEIRDYINLVVFIDVPQDVCVVRMIERTLDLARWQSQGTFAGEASEALVRQLDSVALWLAQYHRARQMYLTVSRRVKAGADVVVDGMLPVEDVVGEVRRKIEAHSAHKDAVAGAKGQAAGG